jgi:BirA family biotin operon repressor/biotin-[acetyl-CoA-carboxylase] ligase
MVEDLSRWAERIERVLRPPVGRVVVLAETASTQDAASRAGQGTLVVAGRQTAGRGRLGRKWEDDGDKTVAMSVAVDARGRTDAGLSLAAGLAALDACASVLRDGRARLGLKWPNDVVTRGEEPRKLAGVLVERSRGLAVLGVGINVLPRRWSRELAPIAGTLSDLRPGVRREDIAEALAGALIDRLRQDDARLAADFAKADAVTGTVRTVAVGAETITGTVIAIDPFGDVVVRAASGERRVPAAQARLVPAGDVATA